MNSNEFVSNGSREATSNVLIDGVSAGGVNMGGLTTRVAYTPSVDGVQEFKVQQTNFSAEYGNSGSTIVNLITRSGTNQLHGSAYDFLRNNDLDSADYFENQNPAPLNKLPHLERNVFGGTVGGPVVIPHLYNGKNKTFFFFDYEGTRQSSLASAYAGVPSAAEKTGDFGELCNDVSDARRQGRGDVQLKRYLLRPQRPTVGPLHRLLRRERQCRACNPHSEQQHRHVHEPRRGISATGRYGARKPDRSRREEADVVFPGAEL